MSTETAEWLIRQREARGWSRPQMARELIKAGRARGEKHLPDPDSLKHNIYRWEHGTGVSHEYVTLYCAVLAIEFREFPRQKRTRSKPKTSTALAVRDHSQVPEHGRLIYRGSEVPPGSFAVEHEVMMAAHESSDHAADHDQQGLGDITLEQLRADVMRLSRQTDTGSPLAAFLDMRRVRDRVYRLLDRRLWPREQADLYFVLGCVNGLMGITANRLGYPDAAEELIRAGGAYANAIDHAALRGLLRAKLSTVMYWRGHFRESHDLAVDGLRYLSQGPMGANLYLNHAQAAARLGDLGTARRAVGLAHAARDSDYSDDLVQLGGEEFALSRATTYAKAGRALAETGDGGPEAAEELGRAISLYDQGGTGDEQHWFGGKPLAITDLALVHLQSGALDAAVEVLAPVMVLPPDQRVSTLTTRLARVRDELVTPAFRDSPQARDLGDQIENFTREAVTASLHSLSG